MNFVYESSEIRLVFFSHYTLCPSWVLSLSVDFSLSFPPPRTLEKTSTTTTTSKSSSSSTAAASAKYEHDEYGDEHGDEQHDVVGGVKLARSTTITNNATMEKDGPVVKNTVLLRGMLTFRLSSPQLDLFKLKKKKFIGSSKPLACCVM